MLGDKKAKEIAENLSKIKDLIQATSTQLVDAGPITKFHLKRILSPHDVEMLNDPKTHEFIWKLRG